MEMIDMSDIGPLIHQLRSRRGWTEQRLADELWVTKEEIINWEDGGEMSFVDAVAVLRILGARVIIKLPD